jgi:2-iminoacetate synthase ThiH
MWFEIAGQNMTSQNKSEYKTTVEDEHWRNEELQWARILSSGNPAKGIVLLYIQKACTAFHEFEPSWKAGALDQGQVEFFRQRLSKRVRQTLVTMENNGLDTINGAAELAEVLCSIESAKTLDELAELTEKMHTVNHLLSDSLEEC